VTRAAAALAVAVSLLYLAPAAGAGERKRTDDLVVLKSEVWIDEVRGTLKNYGTRTAREIAVTVEFVLKSGRKLGQAVGEVGEVPPGGSAQFKVLIPEKLRGRGKYDRYRITTKARWK
jgi:hypothetical protein